MTKQNQQPKNHEINEMENQQSITWLTANQVMKKIGFGRSALYAKIRAGDFPAPIKVGNSSRWVESDVERWMRNFMTGSGNPAENTFLRAG